jgi:hypothetical protein
LEQLSLSAHITDWVYNQFGIRKTKAFQREILHYSGPFDRVQSVRPRVDHIGVIGNFQSLLYVFSDGSTSSIWLVDWHNKVTMTSISSAVCEAHSEDLQIAKGST